MNNEVCNRSHTGAVSSALKNLPQFQGRAQRHAPPAFFFAAMLLLAVTAHAADSGEALTGTYRDFESNERLSLRGTWDAPDVRYRGSGGGAFKKLVVDGGDAQAKSISVRFPGAKEKYLLKFGERSDVLTCQDPSGKAQEFLLETESGRGTKADEDKLDQLAKYFGYREQTRKKVNAVPGGNDELEKEAGSEMTRLMQVYMGPIFFKSLTPTHVFATPSMLAEFGSFGCDRVPGGLSFSFQGADTPASIFVTDTAILRWERRRSRPFEFESDAYAMQLCGNYSEDEVVRISDVPKGFVDHADVRAVGGTQGDPVLRPSKLVISAQKGTRIYVASFDIKSLMPEAKSCVEKFASTRLDYTAYRNCYEAELERKGVLAKLKTLVTSTLAEFP